ncbi:MAG: glycosyltransferase [Sphingomonadaceae bacterium]|jgi:glycosyltransferase involved in cell wall biosynthesis
MSLRVLTFLHSFETGGVERTALRLVAQWQRDGIDAPLWLGRTCGPMRAAHEGRLRYMAGPEIRWPIRHIETLWMITLLPGVIRRLKPDVLFCAGNSYAVVVVAMKLILGRKCPPIVAKISNDLVRADMPWLARKAYHLWLKIQGRIIDRFVGMAEPMRDELSTMLKLGEDRVSIIADPVLDAVVQGAPHRCRGHDALRFITVGRLAPQKDHELMLRAFALGSRPEDILRIVGDGPLEARLRNCAEALGIQDRVIFTGHSESVEADLIGSDVFLLSSRYEGVPAAIVEALAAGLPVIATDCAVSIGALLHNGAFGRTVPVGKVQPLADAIASARSLTIDRDAAIRSVQPFSVASSAREYMSLFKYAVARGPRDAAMPEAGALFSGQGARS